MNRKVIAVHQPNFLPWTGFFYKWCKADLMVFLDNVAFSRRSFINRVRIRDNSNKLWLTIPVLQKGRFNQLICQTEIQDDNSWRVSVRGKLRSCYGKARFFKGYFPEFEAIIKKEYRLLASLNIELLKWLSDKLEIETPWVLSSSLKGVEGKATERLVSICRCLEATHYLSGFGGQKYQEEEIFNKHHIKCDIYDFKHPVYPQLPGDFIPGLSTIDLLFNCGPESPEILKKI
jgi:hypothetical protein